MAKLLIGTSGWSHIHWQGVFYPEGLKQGEWLEYYTRYFKTVEVNVTFYRLPFEGMISGWDKRTSEDFKFVIKGSRRITHFHKLANVEVQLKFMIDRLLPLKHKIYCFLWQLPPFLSADLILLKDFLQTLPETFSHAIEFRHPSWINDSTFSLLKEYRIAHCTVSAPELPFNTTTTADFAYVRLHGISEWYDYEYSDKDLLRLQEEIIKIGKEVETVLIYFNNDTKGFAIKNAIRLKELLEMSGNSPA